MIYSSDNNFLLLKNQKVGGTSLEVELSRIVPENAIVTPRTSDDKAWKLDDEPMYEDYNPRNYGELYNHISYSELSKVLDLSNAKTYIFVRNPFDMVLSHFFHRLKFINLNQAWTNLDNETKNKLLLKYFNNDLGWEWLKSNKHIYIDKNMVCVDKFLFYENGIEHEINNVLPEHGLPRIKLDIIEKAFRPKNIGYLDVFSDKMLENIYSEWSWEFEYFGY